MQQAKKVSISVVTTSAVHWYHDTSFAMDWMSLAKQSKQLVPPSHCGRPRLLPQRFQTQRQACGLCRMCLSVRRLHTSDQVCHLSCRLQSRGQAPQRRQRSLLVAATADTAPHRQSGVKVHGTGHSAEDQNCFTCTIRNAVTVQGSCYGCGLPLQAAQPGVAGYVAADKAAPSVQHKHSKRVLCERCQELSNGRMIPAVEDFSSRQMSGKQPIHT